MKSHTPSFRIQRSRDPKAPVENSIKPLPSKQKPTLISRPWLDRVLGFFLFSRRGGGGGGWGRGFDSHTGVSGGSFVLGVALCFLAPAELDE